MSTKMRNDGIATWVEPAMPARRKALIPARSFAKHCQHSWWRWTAAKFLMLIETALESVEDGV